MKNKKQAGKSIRRLFTQKENKDNFELFYKHLSQTRFHNGFVLCKGLPDERNRILTFFERDSLIERIQFIDMVNPLIDTMGLQESVAGAHEKIENKKDIFFIYNMEDCIERLKTGERDFLEKLNFIRDFFMRYNSVFVFFMTEWLVKEMIRHALDFYDWMKLTFTFIPEKEKKTSSQTISEFEMRKYSNPQEKIEYLKTRIEKASDPQRKLPLLEDIGHLYYQIGNYELALKCIIEYVDILGRSPDKHDAYLALAFNNLSLIYHNMGQMKKALLYAEKSAAIMDALFPKGHPNLTLVKRNLERIKSVSKKKKLPFSSPIPKKV